MQKTCSILRFYKAGTPYFHFLAEYAKLDRVKMVGTCGRINAIWWNIKINLPKLVNMCGYVLPTNVQSLTQKELSEAKKILLKVLWGLLYFESPCSTYIHLYFRQESLCGRRTKQERAKKEKKICTLPSTYQVIECTASRVKCKHRCSSSQSFYFTGFFLIADVSHSRLDEVPYCLTDKRMTWWFVWPFASQRQYVLGCISQERIALAHFCHYRNLCCSPLQCATVSNCSVSTQLPMCIQKSTRTNFLLSK